MLLLELLELLLGFSFGSVFFLTYFTNVCLHVVVIRQARMDALQQAHELLEQELDKAYEALEKQANEVKMKEERELGMKEVETEMRNKDAEIERLNKELFHKEEEVEKLKGELEATWQGRQECEARMNELVEAAEEDRQAYEKKEVEMESQMNSAMAENEEARKALEDEIYNLRHDCARLQRCLRQQERAAVATIETLKAKLCKERSAREEEIATEVNVQTQAYREEMDSMVELQTNRRVTDLARKYEREIQRLKRQLKTDQICCCCGRNNLESTTFRNRKQSSKIEEQEGEAVSVSLTEARLLR